MSKNQRTADSGQRTDKIQELEQKIAELTEALQRERADAINVRRRAEEEKVQAANFYKGRILREFLPAIDSLERALMHTPKDLKDHNYVKGVQGVSKQFDRVLQNLGLERIRTVGERFDPKLHEAVHMEGSEGEHEIITEELQPGYKLGNEVLRHAIVKVKKEKYHERTT